MRLIGMEFKKPTGTSRDFNQFTNQLVLSRLLADFLPAPILFLFQPLENLWTDLDRRSIGSLLSQRTTLVIPKFSMATKIFGEHVEDFTLKPNLDKYVLINVSPYENYRGV